MALSNEKLIKLTATQIQAMSKKEMGVLLVSLIQLCGNTVKRLDVTDGISKNVMGGVSKQLDKLDKVLEIKSDLNSLSENVNSTLGKQVKALENVNNKICHLEQLSNKLEQLDQRFKDSISEINRAQAYQQRFFEEVDARCRRNNIIIMGIPEEDIESPLGSSDLERVECVIQKTDTPLTRGNFHMRRLGQRSSQPRPILLTLECHETGREILNNAKQLRYDNECANIFIRRDIHPTLRFEANRLRIRERNERANPENKNADIQYDRKERVLTKNGVIIDRFRPTFL